MKLIDWLLLRILEEKLKFGAFGKYNRYRCWCVERKVQSIAEKIRLAREVLSGPGVSLAESQHNVDFLRRHSVAAGKEASRSSKDAPAVMQGAPAVDTSAQKSSTDC